MIKLITYLQCITSSMGRHLQPSKQPRKFGRIARLNISLFIYCMFAFSASAADRDWTDCSSANPAIRIQACTNVLRQRTQQSIENRFLALTLRASAYEQKNEIELALDDYNAAITLRRDNTQVFMDRGFIYYKRGDYQHAIADYDAAIGIDPKNARAYSYRGLAFLAQGMADEAISSADKALSLDAHLLPSLATRGSAYAQKGNLEAALSDYRRIRDLAPRAPGIESAISSLEQKLANAKQQTSTVPSTTLLDNQRANSERESTVQEYEKAVVSSEVNIVPIIGHSDGAKSAAFSPDGRFIATGGSDKAVKLWDIKSGRLIRNFEGNSSAVTTIAFMPDGNGIISGGLDSIIRFWNARTGLLLHSFVGHSQPVLSVAVSPDGSRLVSGSLDKTVKIWDISSGRTIRTIGFPSYVWSVAFSRDGRSILSGLDDGTITLWDANSGQMIRSFTGHSGPVLSVAISPDGDVGVSGSRDKTLKVWDLRSGRLLRTLSGHHGDVWSVALSHDGKWILSGSTDRTMKLWNSNGNNDIIQTFELKGSGSRFVTFSPDDRFAFSGDVDSTLWDINKGTPVQRLSNTSTSSGTIDVSSDGRTILVPGTDGKIRQIDVKSGRLKLQFQAGTTEIISAAYSPNGETIIAGAEDGLINLWSAQNGRHIQSFVGHSGAIHSLVFSADGSQILSGSDDKTIKLWNTASGRLSLSISGHSETVRSVAFSPDGRYLLSGSDDKTMKLWDAANGQLVHSFQNRPLAFTAVTFSPDGKQILSGCFDGTIKIWDTESGHEIRRWEGGFINSLKYSSNGKQILSNSFLDGKVMLWEVNNGKLLHTFDGRSGLVMSAIFSKDDQRVYTGSLGGTVKMWNKENGDLLTDTLIDKGGEWITVTPEGFFDASEGGSKLLSLVQGFDVYSIDQVYQQLYRPDLVREKLAGDPKGLVREVASKMNLDVAIGSGAPPDVKIVSPAAGSHIDAGAITAEIDVTDRGGGIGKIEWRVNGVTQGIAVGRGLGRADTADTKLGTIHFTQDLNLLEGENTIEVIAYNSKNLVASVPSKVTFTVRSSLAASGPGKLYVLAVGVNDYWDSRLRLGFAVADASAIMDAMGKAKGDIYTAVEPKLVLDSDVSTDGLDKVFSDLAGKIKPQDTFVFFIAGHGKTLDGRYYYLPRDFQYENEDSIAKGGIGQDRLQAWFAKIPAARSVLLFDTCESGSLIGERIAQRGLERVVAMEKMTQAVGRTIIAASTDDAPALEGYHGHGVLTYSVLRALGEADTDHDGRIEVTELISYLGRMVPELSEQAFKMRQIPQTKFTGSNFPLVARTSVLSADAPVSSEPIPAKPSHVVITAADVFAEAGARGVSAQKLAPGSLVSVIRTEQGWVLVARDGKAIGYVAENALAKVQ